MGLAIGQELQNGQYVIQELLGKGGFGITYKALQVNLNRLVVIKIPDVDPIIDPEYEKEKHIKRFIKEGQTLAGLSQNPHPHIVGVIELFKEGNIPCLVMEFVPGENLFQVVKSRGALPEAEIVPYIRQIGEALVVVHQAGLVHRDAHPGNMMLRSDGRAVLIDFGIAKRIVPATQTSTNKAANEAFAPYEQIVVVDRVVDRREPTLDVYSLAATLYYGVTGTKPTTSLARKLYKEPLIPPQKIIPTISNRLNQAILKGMALEAKDRPQSMQAWLEILGDKPQGVFRDQPWNPSDTVVPVLIPFREVPEKKAIHSALTAIHSILTQIKTTNNPLIKNIPWAWLVGRLLLYILIGYIFTQSHAPVWFWTWAATGANAFNWAAATDDAGVWAVTAAWVFFGAWVVPVAGVWAFVLALVSSVAGALGSHKLRQSSGQFHIVQILTGTVSLGLGLGWILYILFS